MDALASLLQAGGISAALGDAESSAAAALSGLSGTQVYPASIIAVDGVI